MLHWSIELVWTLASALATRRSWCAVVGSTDQLKSRRRLWKILHTFRALEKKSQFPKTYPSTSLVTLTTMKSMGSLCDACATKYKPLRDQSRRFHTLTGNYHLSNLPFPCDYRILADLYVRPLFPRVHRVTKESRRCPESCERPCEADQRAHETPKPIVRVGYLNVLPFWEPNNS